MPGSTSIFFLGAGLFWGIFLWLLGFWFVLLVFFLIGHMFSYIAFFVFSTLLSSLTVYFHLSIALPPLRCFSLYMNKAKYEGLVAFQMLQVGIFPLPSLHC